MLTWTQEADARLFLAILAEHPVKVDYKKVAERFGNGATPRAIVERLQKLRAKAAVTSAGNTSGNGEEKASLLSAPNTPRKRRNQRVIEGGVVKVQGRRRVKREETETEEEEQVEI